MRWHDFWGDNHLVIFGKIKANKFYNFWPQQSKMAWPQVIYNPITEMGFSAMFTF